MKKTSSHESAIRDFLFSNLSSLTPGLVAIDKEVHLPNSDGADGFIDILAEDAQGCRVVIELKRSANSSRSAIHEIEKYVALLKKVHGISERDLRVIVVSTDWHELLTPFSSYSRKTKYPVEGFIVVTTPTGRVVSSSRIQPLDELPSLQFSEFHFAFCFADKTRRDSACEEFATLVTSNGVSDFCVFSFDNPDREIVVYPYCLYLAPAWQTVDPSTFPKMLSPPVSDELFWEGFEEDVEDPLEFGNERWLDWFRSNAYSSLRPDEASSSSPRAASPMFMRGWKLTQVLRRGRWRGTEKFLTEQELWLGVCGYGTTNPILFFDRSSIGHTARWNSFRARVGAFLGPAPDWGKPLTLYLEELSRVCPEATVHLMMCLQDDILVPIERFLRMREPREFSHIELDCDSKPHRKVIGMLEWQYRRPLRRAEDAIKSAFDSFEEYVFTKGGLQFHALPTILENLGLKLSLFEWFPDGDVCWRLSAEKGRLVRRKVKKNSLKGMETFVEAHPEFVQHTATMIREHVFVLE